MKELGSVALEGDLAELVLDFARAVGRMRGAQRVLDATGQIITRGGRVALNPASAAAAEADREVRRLAADLGIQPYTPRQYDPARHCGAANQAGAPCTNGKGAGTNHPGVLHCASHGGSTPNGKRAATKAIVAQALDSAIKSPSLKAVLALVDRGSITGDPKAALREMLAVSLWREQCLRMLAEQSDAPVYGADHQGDGRAFVLWEMHGDAVKATSTIAKMLGDQSLGEEGLNVEREKVETLARIVQAALVEAAVPPEMRDAVLRSMTRQLTPIAPTGAGLQ